MKNKIVKTKGQEDVVFDVIPGILVGAFQANTEYICTSDEDETYTFHEFAEKAGQCINIKKIEFDKIKNELDIM